MAAFTVPPGGANRPDTLPDVRNADSRWRAGKGAVKSMTKALAKEWVRYNITVNCVAPGYTDTDLFPPLARDEDLRTSVEKQNVPMRRFARPEEIAAPVVYLASDQASYVTGESFHIDGGVLA